MKFLPARRSHKKKKKRKEKKKRKRRKNNYKMRQALRVKMVVG
jgi:hypothetical protein